MELTQAIRSRRSNRRYKPESVSQEQIHAILDAGFCAPSAHNVKPLEYIVIEDKNLLVRMSETMPYGRMLADAPCAIAVVGRPDLQEEAEWLIQDAAVAMENMLLVIHDLGLGGVYLGVLGSDPMRKEAEKLLEIPESYRLMSVCCFGVPQFVKAASERFETHRVHHNSWRKNL